MKSIWNRTSILALGVLALGSVAHPSEAQAELETGLQSVTQAEPSESDKQLTQTVQSKLQAEEALRPSMENIQLKTVKGIVYVKGIVSSEAEKAQIESVIRACPDVSAVQNYITVSSTRA